MLTCSWLDDQGRRAGVCPAAAAAGFVSSAVWAAAVTLHQMPTVPWLRTTTAAAEVPLEVEPRAAEVVADERVGFEMAVSLGSSCCCSCR